VTGMREGRPDLPRVMPRAIIFDMDGLLLDTEVLAAQAWDEAAAAQGVSFDRALALSLVGRNFRDCIELVRAHCGSDYPCDAVLGGWHAAYDAVVEREGVRVKAGARELLAWVSMQDLPCAVATSTRAARARAKLGDAGLLDALDALVGGDEVARGKPAPNIYIEAARRLHALPTHCFVLEDSEPGVRGALAAGMTAILVPDIAPPSAALLALRPHVAASLHEVHEHLRSLAPSRTVESAP